MNEIFISMNKHLRHISWIILLLLAACGSDNRLELELDNGQNGFYYIIYTTDNSKAPVNVAEPLHFDENKVLYLNEHYTNGFALAWKDGNGNNISERMWEVEGTPYFRRFYHPTEKELGQKPLMDDYYLNVTQLAKQSALVLLQKGYLLVDTNLAIKPATTN